MRKYRFQILNSFLMHPAEHTHFRNIIIPKVVEWMFKIQLDRIHPTLDPSRVKAVNPLPGVTNTGPSGVGFLFLLLRSSQTQSSDPPHFWSDSWLSTLSSFWGPPPSLDRERVVDYFFLMFSFSVFFRLYRSSLFGSHGIVECKPDLRRIVKEEAWTENR